MYVCHVVAHKNICYAVCCCTPDIFMRTPDSAGFLGLYGGSQDRKATERSSRCIIVVVVLHEDGDRMHALLTTVREPLSPLLGVV